MNVAPYRLVSLLSMMNVKARPFIAAVDLIAQVLIASHDETLTLDDAFVSELQDQLASLRAEVAKLDLSATLISIDRLAASLDKTTKMKKLRNLVVEIRGRLMDEVAASYILTLTSEERSYFAPGKPLFGSNVATAFPSASFEIDEAGKCYAIGRGTAAVFHLMRTVELGIRAVSRCLQIPDPTKPAERNWGYILKEIHKGIESRWPTAAVRHVGDAAYFESVYASLDAIKNPWRNSTMHVERVYTLEEARHIFDAVGGLMRKISEKMDEHGQPPA